MNALGRLVATIGSAGIPVDGACGTSSANVRIDYNASASQAQRTQGASIVAAFDWSSAADASYMDAQSPDLATMRDNAQAAINTNATYIALASPSTAQNTAQIKALSQQHQQIIKALKLLAIASLK